MTPNAEVRLERSWEFLLSTWSVGTYFEGHTWVVYQQARWREEGGRFAVRYFDTPDQELIKPLRSPEIHVDDVSGRLGRTVLLDAPSFERVLHAGRSRPIPCVNFEGCMGLDGNRRGFRFDDGWTRLDLEWWSTGPDEWCPFTEWVEALQELLHRSLFPNEATYWRGRTA